jgi:hypothetical protein
MDDILKEEEQYIEQVALAVIKILKKEKAVRLADNVNPDGIFLEALLCDLEDLGFPISAITYYNKVRPKCIELGYSITSNGKGQYIGGKGEWTRNIKNARDQILGRTHNQRKILTLASDHMSLDEGNEYSKKEFKMSLVEMSKLFDVVGKAVGDNTLPWPKELQVYLAEGQS